MLRQETGLRLRRSVRDSSAQSDLFDGALPQIAGADQITVRVELVPGLPRALLKKEIADKDRLAALIAPWRDSLEQLRNSARDVNQLVRLLAGDPVGWPLVEPGAPSILPVTDLAERLLRESATFNLAKWILDVREDVLGTYRYVLPKSILPMERRRQEAWIELYWAVIGLFARLMVVEVEDLTVVVLAHELAHAYTHLGTDIDGHAWSAEDFAASDHELKEGLAQLYGHIVCQRLALNAPRAKAAFDRLLIDQPKAYHSHAAWEARFKPEELRLALLRIRRQGIGKRSEFEGFLRSAEGSLRSGKRGQVPNG